jgi:hypothetical protein
MKNKILSVVITLIAPAVFNACYFTIVGTHGKSRWICWGAIHMAYLALCGASYSIPRVKGGNVYGYPKIGVAWTYFVVMLIAGLVFIAINPVSVASPVLVLVIITGGFLAVYAFHMKAEEHSIAGDRAGARHLHFIRDCSEQLAELMRQASGAGRKKQIERVYDAIRNAQGASVTEAAGVETQIMAKIGRLGSACPENDGAGLAAAAEEILSLIRRRDSMIRMAR